MLIQVGSLGAIRGNCDELDFDDNLYVLLNAPSRPFAPPLGKKYGEYIKSLFDGGKGTHAHDVNVIENSRLAATGYIVNLSRSLVGIICIQW